MSTEEVRAARDRWLQVWNEGKLDLVSETLGASYVRHEPNGTRTVTMDQYREEIAATRKRIPDIHFTPNDEAITEDSWWVRWTSHGTNAETGERITTASIQIYRITDGRIVETWYVRRARTSWDD
jgi:predicted ester cyclase